MIDFFNDIRRVILPILKICGKFGCRNNQERNDFFSSDEELYSF
jgi:hypothetical protein